MMGEMVVHWNALFEDEPLAVDCFAYNNKEGILAVARHTDTGTERKSEAVIELWNAIGTPTFLLRTLRLGHDAAQSILWVEDSDSLIVAHMDGRLAVYHTHSDKVEKFQICATPIWCLASIKANLFCAGTDSGAVFLLEMVAERINVVKTVNIGFGSRVLSVACNGTVLAAGSLDVVHLIEVQHASIKHTLKLPRDESRKPTVVWALCFIDGILASGDSRGCVCFWNAGNGALVQTVQTHQADVLSLCAVREALYASGVDPSIARLNYHNKDRTNWRVESRRNLHENDVRALTSSRTALFSGGAEHHFVASTRNKHYTPMKLTPFRTAPCNGSLLVYEYLHRVVVWRAAVADGVAKSSGRFNLCKDPVKLSEIRMPRGDHVITTAISPTGTMLAIAKSTSVSVYLIRTTEPLDAPDDCENPPDFAMIKQLPVRATALVFCGKWLIMASAQFELSMVHCDKLEEQLQTVYSKESAGTVVRLHANHDATEVVALTTRNEVYIVSLSNKKKSRKLKLDAACIVMDAQFMNDSTLFILCADNERTLLEYSLSDRTPSTKIITRQMLTMAQDELVMDMQATTKGTVLMGSKGTIRIIQTSEGKRRLAMLPATPSGGGTIKLGPGPFTHAAAGKPTTTMVLADEEADFPNVAAGDIAMEPPVVQAGCSPQTVAQWWNWQLGYRGASHQQQGAENGNPTTKLSKSAKRRGKSLGGVTIEPPRLGLAAGGKRKSAAAAMGGGFESTTNSTSQRSSPGSGAKSPGPGQTAVVSKASKATTTASSRDSVLAKRTRADRCVAARLLVFSPSATAIARVDRERDEMKAHAQRLGLDVRTYELEIGWRGMEAAEPILMVSAPRELPSHTTTTSSSTTPGAFRRKRYGQN